MQPTTYSAWRRGLALLVVGLGAISPAAAADLGFSFYTGFFEPSESAETVELGVEVQRSLGPPGLAAVAGLAASADEAVWVYGGASWSWTPNEKWRLRPGFAVSVFEEGDGKDLGGPIEFRSSLEVSYRLRSRFRLGLLVYHLSNAGIYERNPGSNSLALIGSF